MRKANDEKIKKDKEMQEQAEKMKKQLGGVKVWLFLLFCFLSFVFIIKIKGGYADYKQRN